MRTVGVVAGRFRTKIQRQHRRWHTLARQYRWHLYSYMPDPVSGCICEPIALDAVGGCSGARKALYLRGLPTALPVHMWNPKQTGSTVQPLTWSFTLNRGLNRRLTGGTPCGRSGTQALASRDVRRLGSTAERGRASVLRGSMFVLRGLFPVRLLEVRPHDASHLYS